MLQQKIKYTDYNGVEREETFMFNLTKAEVTEMELSLNGGLTTKIQRIVETRDGEEIIKLFKEIILKAYGVKSDDGRRFIKSEELSDEFSQTEAYSQLFMRLCTDADEAAKFMNGVVPDDTTPAQKYIDAQKEALNKLK